MKYKVFSNVMDVRQETTSINTKGISGANIYNHVTETLYNRFKDYRLSINHAGRTVTINYKEE